MFYNPVSRLFSSSEGGIGTHAVLPISLPSSSANRCLPLHCLWKGSELICLNHYWPCVLWLSVENLGRVTVHSRTLTGHLAGERDNRMVHQAEGPVCSWEQVWRGMACATLPGSRFISQWLHRLVFLHIPAASATSLFLFNSSCERC
jgi:hypothetical protein